MPDQPNRNPWHNRFAHPTQSDLDTLYEPDVAATLHTLLELIESRTGARPDIEWRGIAWRWTLAYRRPGEDEAWAYVIPAEERPTVAVPIPADPLSAGQLRKTPRFIRDGIRTAARIGQVCWLETPVETQANAEDLARFIDAVTEAQPA